ncbi:MAG TPA: hypothetical protein DIV41_03155 [Ruminococcaceae bacterium]|nr:hypothetical protein [Oscillospiraceae bacterium]
MYFNYYSWFFAGALFMLYGGSRLYRYFLSLPDETQRQIIDETGGTGKEFYDKIREMKEKE